MKRALDSVGGLVEDPPAKRTNGEDREAEEENQDVAKYVLVNKSRSLALELMSSKRSLAEARKELDLMRKQVNEMESLVSLVQRSWSQIDIDTSLLLDSISEIEARGNSEHNSTPLRALLEVGNRWASLDSTNNTHLPRLDIDAWSTAADIKLAEKSAMETEDEFQLEVRQSHGSEVAQLVPQQVEAHLQAHVAFTMSLLERLCSAIYELSDRDEDIFRPLAIAQEQHGAVAALTDANLKLRSEYVAMQARLQLADNEKSKVEKKLDKALFTIKAMEEHGHQRHSGANIAGWISSSDATIVNGSTDHGGLMQLHHQQQQQQQYEQELLQQIALLEKQLGESETAKARAEMTTTERMAKPFSQTEQQVSDMRRTLEELKHQFKQRLTEYVKQAENISREKYHLQTTLIALEKVAADQLQIAMQATQNELQRLTLESQQLQQKVTQMQAAHIVSSQVEFQCKELIALEEARTKRISQLEQSLERLQAEKAQLHQYLEQSQNRERTLESVITAHINQASSANAQSELSENAELPNNIAALQSLLTSRQRHYQGIDNELAESKTSVNDLILELGAETDNTTRLRDQNERLLKQLQESQVLQRNALEENLKLNQQMEEMKRLVKETEARGEGMKSLLTQQDTLLTDVRVLEASLRSEIFNLSTDRQLQVDRCHSLEVKTQDLEHQLQDVNSQLQKALKRNQDLHGRCDELSKQNELERKRRFDEMRDTSKHDRLQHESSSSSAAAASSSSSSRGSGKLKSTDQDMLDMTLDMLRCSVCRDRFKSVAITRCFHLFCKECIDENLRNRSRKCPACGEKFGQDDVANVYFGN